MSKGDQRRLAAIVSADVVGYSRLIGRDEAGTLAALRQGVLKDDPRWSEPSVGYAVALFGIGWLCPGAGQILQKRDKTGWLLLVGYVGSKILIGFLLSHTLITVQQADMLAWISLVLQWGVMIEAPLWMVKAIWQK